MFRSGDVRVFVAGDSSTEGAAALSKAFVRAELIGGAISSSELSFSEYVRAWFWTGTESLRLN